MSFGGDTKTLKPAMKTNINNNRSGSPIPPPPPLPF